MKFLSIILGSIAVITVFSGEYEVDLFNGVMRFTSQEEAVESGIIREFNRTNQFKQFKLDTDPRVETKDGSPVDPMPVRFHSKNRLRNGDLVILKRKLFGNNMRDGYRFIVYFYGSPSLGECLKIMNDELGLDNKYQLQQYKRNDKYAWLEVRSRFILLD